MGVGLGSRWRLLKWFSLRLIRLIRLILVIENLEGEIVTFCQCLKGKGITDNSALFKFLGLQHLLQQAGGNQGIEKLLRERILIHEPNYEQHQVIIHRQDEGALVFGEFVEWRTIQQGEGTIEN